MMQTFRTESNYRSAARLTAPELRAAQQRGEILQSTALAFDTQRQLWFELGGVRGMMPFAESADGAERGAVREIAVVTRVGRPTCFVIQDLSTDGEEMRLTDRQSMGSRALMPQPTSQKAPKDSIWVTVQGRISPGDS